jgi:hypothetical protein
MTDKLTTTMQIAERIYSLAQEQNDSGLMIGAYGYLACTLYLLGDFETARQYAKRGVEIWRSGAEQFPVEDWIAPAIHCLCYQALSEWHLGEVASCKVTIAEAISLAKQLHDTQASVFLLYWSAHLAYFPGNLTEMERLASELIEKSTRHKVVGSDHLCIKPLAAPAFSFTTREILSVLHPNASRAISNTCSRNVSAGGANLLGAGRVIVQRFR